VKEMQNWANIFQELRKGLGISQQKMADDLGIPQRTWANYESGRSKPTLDIAATLAKKGYEIPGLTPSFYNFNTSIEAQLKAKPAGGHKVPLLRQKVSCGPGVDWETDDNIEEYIDVFSILPRLATGRMYAFKASGSSMLGAGIRSGDYLIFDAELGFIPKDDDIYVFTLDGEVYCKRLEFDMLANKIKIYSVRVADLEKAELVRTLDMTEASYGDRFRIFGRVRYLLRPNRGDD
jgi:transcriptional regulator with XRE-family HTH domain